MGSITTAIYPSLKLVHFHGTGDITYELIIEKTLQIHTHPDWQFNFNAFVDFEDAELSAQIDGANHYNSFFTELQKTTPSRKWAIYTRSELTHKNANMSLLLGSTSIKVDVFQHRDDALQYLDISPEQFEKVCSL